MIKRAQIAHWAWALSLVVATQATAQAAPATSPQKAEVLVVLGVAEGKGGVDPALSALPALGKAPFDSFKEKTLLSKTQVILKADTPATVDLPNGRKMQLKLLGRNADGRFQVQVSINRPGKKDYLPVMTVVAASGDPFFVAGQKYREGTLIIGVRIGSSHH